jgi:hypothetical protein
VRENDDNHIEIFNLNNPEALGGKELFKLFNNFTGLNDIFTQENISKFKGVYEEIAFDPKNVEKERDSTTTQTSSTWQSAYKN